MALDHPDKVTQLAVLDIVPTYYLYTHVTIEFVQAYFHWFNYLRPAPGPENEIEGAERRRAWRGRRIRFRSSTCAPPVDQANIHAMCEDYRAGASIDLKHDEADLDKKIDVPAARAVGRARTDGPALRRARRSGRNAGRRSPAKGCPAGTI